jgi:hypothetical protein|tara:strand:+ start:690 stop:1376 length:687 start_codon:yes stop_codon:yes gene_type:complete
MWYKRKCKTCLEKYVPIQETQKFCGAICRNEWWKKNSYSRKRSRTVDCLTCGEEFVKYNDNHKFCSSSCKPTFVEPKKPKEKDYPKINPLLDMLKKIYKFYNRSRKPISIKMNDLYSVNDSSFDLGSKKDDPSISTGKKGAITEHEFMCLVGKRGWECFTNFSPDGPVDLVIYNWKNKKEIYFIDAKTNPLSILSETQKNLGIKKGYIDRDRNVAVISDSDNNIIRQI